VVQTTQEKKTVRAYLKNHKRKKPEKKAGVMTQVVECLQAGVRL
jgi:hypothetical protein